MDTIERFEFLEQSLRTLCYILRWYQNSAFRKSTLAIQVEEIDMSIDIFCKLVQLQTFGKSLNVESATLKFPALKDLCPIVKDGLMVVGGRLNQKLGLF